MSGAIDVPGAVREGEELDLERLQTYLDSHLGPLSAPIEVQQFRQGHSNLTYLLRSGDQEWVLRRPPFSSKVKTAHDMLREYTVLSRLAPIYAPAPAPVLFCEDQSVIGAKFYLMRRIHGIILRGRKPANIEYPPETVRACCTAFVTNLAALHAFDYEAAGLGALRKPGQYATRQVMGWSDRYRGSQTDEIPEIDATIAWLQERIPPDTGAVLVHNDYKFDNLVFAPDDPTRIVGVLDWEMSTIGDPLMDLGTSLGYWVELDDPDELKLTQCFLTSAPGAMTRLELAQLYSEQTGRDVSNMLFYHVFSLLKIAVILQQIYYRYVKGFTKDERFAPLIFFVRALGRKAANAIETGRV